MSNKIVKALVVCVLLFFTLDILLICRMKQAGEQDTPAATETPLYATQPQPTVTPTHTHTPRPTAPPERDTGKEDHSTVYSYPTPRRSTPTPKKSTVTTDPYDIHDYSDPEEFYYYNYDDFYDYYDAEEYYNEYMY